MTDHQPREWAELWEADRPPEPARLQDLRAEAARRRRRMKLTVAAEVAVTTGAVALSVLLLRDGGPHAAARLAWLWLTWLIAAGFATWNRWGVWGPETESAVSYLALAEERARRRWRVAVFVLVLTGAQGALLFLAGLAGTPATFVVVLYAAWAVWYGWRARRDMAEVGRIATEFRQEERV